MKVLHSCRENLKFFGIHPPLLQSSSSTINLRNSSVVFIFVLNSILAIVFLSCKAENIGDYAESFGPSWTCALGVINFSFLIYKICEVFQFIGRLEEVINKSKDGDTSNVQIRNAFTAIILQDWQIKHQKRFMTNQMCKSRNSETLWVFLCDK